MLPGATVQSDQGFQILRNNVALVDPHLEFAAAVAARDAIDGLVTDLLHERLAIGRN